jgi:hypothetical protein
MDFLIHIASRSVSSHFMCVVFVIDVLSTSLFSWSLTKQALYLIQTQSNFETTICNFEPSQQQIVWAQRCSNQGYNCTGIINARSNGIKVLKINGRICYKLITTGSEL